MQGLLAGWTILLLVITSNISVKCQDDGLVEVDTKLGTVTGRKVTTLHDGTEMYTFKGIPYAQPPVGDLRFKPPQPVDPWGSLSALEQGDICPQFDSIAISGKIGFAGSEDCLSLNIYTPSLPNEDSDTSSLKPVMVWIHGGSFIEGTGRHNYPDEIVVTQDVLVVTINYRLGLLGFFSLGTDVAPGNLGIRDQIEALKWVRQHIDKFGGDPDQVTIFGSSAGSRSVHSLTLSPLASGLFTKAISQSGVFLTHGHSEPYLSLYLSSKAALELGCNKSSPLGPDAEGIVKCLNNFSAEELTMVFKTPDGEVKDIIHKLFANRWGPINDPFSSSSVLPLDSLAAMKYGAFNKVPIMLGTVLNEGAIGIKHGLGHDEKSFREMAVRASVAIVKSFDEVTDDQLVTTRILKRFYTGNDEATDQEIADLWTDAWFLSPVQKAAQLTSKHVPDVFNYVITHKSPRVSHAPIFNNITNRSDLHPVHGDDVLFLFDETEGVRGEFLGDDLLLRRSMIKYWGNFAKFGHPTPSQSDNLTTWLPYNDEKNYMDLKPVPEMKTYFEAERMLLWDKLFFNDRENELVDKYEVLGRLRNFFQ